jgi:hypothetical protein
MHRPKKGQLEMEHQMLLTQANEPSIPAPAEPVPQARSSGPRRIAAGLRASILDAYVPSCVYLKEAWRDTDCLTHLVSHGRFSVPRTFYGEQTGHFNAVESALCLNQLAFVTMADFVLHRDGHRLRDAICTRDIDDFKKNVVSRTFVASMSTRFRRLLDGRHVQGELRMKKFRAHGAMLFVMGTFAFDDADGAGSRTAAFTGEVVFAMPRI